MPRHIVRDADMGERIVTPWCTGVGRSAWQVQPIIVDYPLQPLIRAALPGLDITTIMSPCRHQHTEVWRTPIKRCLRPVPSKVHPRGDLTFNFRMVRCVTN